MIKAEVYITLKSTVADPQGLTVKHALESLGHRKIADVRMGKIVTVELDVDDKDKAKKQLDDMCKKLLANPIIENYRINLQ